MDDDFYHPVSNATEPAGLLARTWRNILAAPPSIIVTVLLAPILIVVATRLRSERPSKKVDGKDGRTVWMLPHWFPVLGHGFSFLYDPIRLMSQARSQSPHGIFALNLGMKVHNVISDPTLVKGVMNQKESAISFFPISWSVCEKFFGIPRRSKVKYDRIWDEFVSHLGYLMKEPHLSKMLKATIRNFETNIPQMISYIDTEIDLQPWERMASPRFVSDTEAEINLMSLLRDLMGHASIPAMFGRAILEKYPDLLQDIYEMDKGMMFFLIGLPPWFPWPGVLKAHMARMRIWEALDDQQEAMDAAVDGKDVDYMWGDLDDVSDFIWKRHAMFKNNGFEIKERADISVLWALTVNSNLLIYWHILHILATPNLLPEILTEISPYATITKPESIGRISEAPKLTLNHEGLAKKCPLFKSTFFEALRISGQPWSIRQVASDVSIPTSSTSPDSTSYFLKKGDYVTVPHDLHMRDPAYFRDPDKFEPKRFLVGKEDGTQAAEMGTIRPFGAGPSMCKGRLFAERECMALVAGVLMFWEFGPVNEKGWVIPEQVKSSAVSRPKVDTRVRVRRRKFEW